MLNFKDNFRTNKTDLTCELCHNNVEDDDHIFNTCTELDSIRGNIHRNQLFENNTNAEQLHNIADFLIQVEKKLRKL